jgi:hypothetical protein
LGTEDVRALALVKRAWSLKHTPQIAWTRAVVLKSADSKQAIQAWRDYLAIDKDKDQDPRWREEAQRELQDLEHPPY